MFALGVTLGETLADVSWICSIAATSKKRPKCADAFIVVDDPRAKNRHDRQQHHVQDKRSALGQDHAFFDELAALPCTSMATNMNDLKQPKRRFMRVQAMQPRSRTTSASAAP